MQHSYIGDSLKGKNGGLAENFQTSFRDAMASCAAGVHVITTDGAAGRYGITMTAVTPITDEPPTVMLCINRKARIIPILSENGSLCINTLADEHQDVAEHFAGLTGLSPEERFAYHIRIAAKRDNLK